DLLDVGAGAEVELDPGELLGEGGGAPAAEELARLLPGARPVGLLGEVLELGVGAGGAALLLVAGGEVLEGAEGGVEAVALLEALARLVGAAGVEELEALLEERVRVAALGAGAARGEEPGQDDGGGGAGRHRSVPLAGERRLAG